MAELYSEEMKAYFESLQREIDRAYEIARKARAQGKDPSTDVEVPQATDMAGRVESLVGPPGVAERIRALVKEYGKELAALKVVDEIIDGKFGDLGSKEKYAEQAVRTALAILTEGIVSAPLEGIADVKIKRNEWADGSEYLALYYAGPIRSSGGTAQALSVLVGDYVRKKLGLDRFKPSEKHIERMVEEIDLYHRAVTRLQYHPEADEVRLAMKNIPIEITGEETDKVEVSHRDVPGVETNHLRGGAILVLAEGVLQKAKKLVKYIDKMGIEGWDWIKEFVDAKEKGKAEVKEEKVESAGEEAPTEKVEEKIEKGFYYELYEKFRANIAPNKKYTKEIIGGRPLFAEPSTNGGFRLRYGRSRVSGFATWSVNPATMLILDEFIAIGTQMKTERPGKGCIVTPATTVEGPIVKLKDGSVIRVDDYQTALKIRDKIEEILYVGDALVNFGDFVENNQTLLPANYAEEWWIQEFAKAIADIYEVELKPFEDNPREAVEEAAEYVELDPDFLERLLKDPLRVRPSIEEAIHISKVLDIPFHPYYTLYWNTLKPEEVEDLQKALLGAQIEWGEHMKNKFARKVVLDNDSKIKRYLELLGLPHRLERTEDRKKVIVIEYPWSAALLTPLGNLEWEFKAKPFHTVIDIINKGNRIKLRDRGISWIGARMGRPEKAKERKMKPPVQVLFPIGLAGGSSRDIKKAAEEGKTTEVEIAFFKCPKCGHVGPEHICPSCGTRKELLWHCPKCSTDYLEGEADNFDFRCPKCGIELKPYARRRIKPSELLRAAMENVKVYGIDKLKGVQGMTSGYKMAEPLEKGLLRAKNDVYVFKDGTIRFDATDAPITHFKPREIGVSVEKLRELGYTHDFEGKPLERDDQIVELKVQDVILSYEAGRYLLKVARFIDDLLEKFYGLPRFYNAEKMEDLIGHLVIGLAPHTSAGIIGRIIGFSDVLVGYAHPYYHAAKRRNCFPGDTRILVQIDGMPMRITLRELYELFEDEHYENMVYVRKRPKVDVKVYSFDPESGKVVLTDIEDVIKVPSTDHLIRFELELGREFETTVDHPVLVYEGGRFVEKRAFEVKGGDRILVPRIEFDEVEVENLDLLEAFSDENFGPLWDSIMVRGLSRWLSSIGAGVKSDYLRRDSVPLSELFKVLKEKGLKLTDVPDCRLAFKRDRVAIRRFVPVEPLMRVLGYYLAEGYARKSDSVYQISFSIADEEVHDDLKMALREAFGDGFGIYERGEKVTVGSRILYLLFTEVLKAGTSAHTKRVPPIVYTLPRDAVAEMLRAYFEGDGSALRTAPRVVAYSVNKSLLEDIETLLLSKFGIRGYYTVDKNANRGNARGRLYHVWRGREPPVSTVYALNIAGEHYHRFFREIGFISERKNDVYSLHETKVSNQDRYSNEYGWVVKVKRIEYLKPKDDFVFSLNAKDYHNVLVNENIVTHQCDGDEDAVMLLLDALLNFSKYYLPEKRGGKMDAPLVVTTRLDPREVDSEVHNMDVVRYYPLEFYVATYGMKSPKEIKFIERVEDRLGKPEMYEGIKFTHDTDDIGLGPKMSLYKQLGDMEEKVARQLALAERIRAVDEHHVAETIINSHLVPDLRGNLRSFTRQEFRCVKCNTKYRRPPLTGKCPKCGGKIVLTVSKGAIEKYLPTAKMLVTRYNVLDYTRQRICMTEKDIKSLFENVFPERQRTLMGFSADICEKMIKARTGKSNGRNGYLDELKANGKLKKKAEKSKAETKAEKKSKKAEKKTKPSEGLENDIRKEKSKMKKPKKGISLDEFFGS
ncbi:DNA-directed DNA polymerase II large subunit [Thermococcus sp. GR7]|uniref:DNA-directed DNA polymerase II large subunit n=1 Tax=unclassified Thermococcus TaxID=2627626 RepID=UPI00143228C9|nr:MULTISPECIES: DNA-directed DNA polymerase II large subunit [unclassified Thermococcus]NJE46142.1 DNA-directed DNA polymerase II large subunit [Thermococcus sp. GR7]NJE78222.1 DNA-directed DNA polymerase II large subunit [Thermococcus sp. GR4]NJF22339.1 DNA-directed DNA polymerase II large subunit [Thermococcus sp. GR5]